MFFCVAAAAISSADLLAHKKRILPDDFVKRTNAAGLALSMGAGLDFLRVKAPALVQGAALHLWTWSHLIKEADAWRLVRGPIAVPYSHANQFAQ